MKYFLLALLIPFAAYAQVGPPDYRNNPSKWIYGNNPTPIANVTPVALITAVPTPTGTPSSQRYYITDLTVSNSHASVDTDVQLLNGSAIFWVCPAVHSEGGCAQNFTTPLRGAANSNWSC